MPNRAAKFASAMFASLLAGAALAIVAPGPARAADDCLAAPKDETPAGGHWYYRIDHATKRHCWYLRGEGEKLSQTAPPDSAHSAKPTESKAESPAQHSIENAHAELPPQTGIEQPSFKGTLTPADAAVWENNPAAAMPGASAAPSTIATRWPEPGGLSSAAGPQPQASNPAASASPDKATARPDASPAVPLAAADSSPPTRTGSIPKLLSAVSGALALAGITASVVLKLAGPRQAKLRVRRDAVWDPTDDDRIVLSQYPDQDISPPRTGFSRDLERSGDANDRIAEFFSQLSRRAPT